MTRDRDGERVHRFSRVGVMVLTALVVAGGGTGLAAVPSPAAGTTAAGVPAPGSRMALMRAAAREFSVPVQLLLAISYDQTRWQPPGSAPSIDGGYGLMDLTARTFPAAVSRGLASRPLPRTVTLPRTHNTLNEAAALLHLPLSALQASDRQNIRGAAAVLARYALQLSGGKLPASLNGWYGAVAAYSGATTIRAARTYADDVYHTLASGAALTTIDGQVMDLPPTPGLRPDRSLPARLGLKAATATSTAVDCPSTINCTFTPAAYASDSRTDPTNYGNYDTGGIPGTQWAGRPDDVKTPAGGTASMKISSIVIHDTEGSYASAIATFQNPANYVSANYVVQSSTGDVTEMVRPQDVSWGAGDWYVNMHAINIENEGYAAQGSTWYTPAMYQTDAALVRYLAAKYGIPLDREHIIGHEDVPGPTTYYTSIQHWDPGPFWNWNHFMALVHQASDATERANGGSATRGTHQLVTIDPVWSSNKPVVTNYSNGSWVKLPSQPANFVYVRTGPGGSYPLIADPVLYPNGGTGTTHDSDWGDKATIGQRFVIAAQSGNWTAIWFAGRKAWFYNPSGSQQEALYTGGYVITPKTGLSSIRVYGAAYPKNSAFPTGVNPPVTPPPSAQITPYTIKAGQKYPVIPSLVPTDYFYAATWNYSYQDDHTIIIGTTPYYQISFNHRKFFVQASQVTLQKLP